MSLGVGLEMVATYVPYEGSTIFVMKCGAKVEIAIAEWRARNPGIVPCVVKQCENPPCLYSDNITHNLAGMAKEAGVYYCCWRPDDIGITKASQMICPLRSGIDALESEPDKFRKMNPTNGWGDYECLVKWLKDYLAACEKYPFASVRVSR